MYTIYEAVAAARLNKGPNARPCSDAHSCHGIARSVSRGEVENLLVLQENGFPTFYQNRLHAKCKVLAQSRQHLLFFPYAEPSSEVVL